MLMRMHKAWLGSSWNSAQGLQTPAMLLSNCNNHYMRFCKFFLKTINMTIRGVCFLVEILHSDVATIEANRVYNSFARFCAFRWDGHRLQHYSSLSTAAEILRTLRTPCWPQPRIPVCHKLFQQVHSSKHNIIFFGQSMNQLNDTDFNTLPTKH